MSIILHNLCVEHTRQVQIKALAKCSYLLHEDHGLGPTVRKRLLETILHCVKEESGDVCMNAVKAVRSAADCLKPMERKRVIEVFLEARSAETSFFSMHSDRELVEAINVAFESLTTSCSREEFRDFLVKLERFVREKAAGMAASTVVSACVLQ